MDSHIKALRLKYSRKGGRSHGKFRREAPLPLPSSSFTKPRSAVRTAKQGER